MVRLLCFSPTAIANMSNPPGLYSAMLVLSYSLSVCWFCWLNYRPWVKGGKFPMVVQCRDKDQAQTVCLSLQPLVDHFHLLSPSKMLHSFQDNAEFQDLWIFDHHEYYVVLIGGGRPSLYTDWCAFQLCKLVIKLISFISHHSRGISLLLCLPKLPPCLSFPTLQGKQLCCRFTKVSSA